MTRREFGRWGIELSDNEFAQALAVLGILTAERDRPPKRGDRYNQILSELARQSQTPLLPWRLSRYLPTETELESLPSARRLSIAWAKSRFSGNARLEVQGSIISWQSDELSALPWIVAMLSRSDVAARSVYVRADAPLVEVGWTWPLRIGFLRDPASAALSDRCRAHLKDRELLAHLASVVDARSGDGNCDLLLLPFDLRGSLSAATALEAPLRVECAVVLGRESTHAAATMGLIDGLRAALRTSAVVVAHVPRRREEDWLTAVVRELSRNYTLDVALFNAAREIGIRVPFISASRHLLDVSRFTHQLRRMGKLFLDETVEKLQIDVTHRSWMREYFGLPTGPHALGELGRRINSIFVTDASESPKRFDAAGADSIGPIATAEAADAAAASAASAEPVAEEARYIQSRVFEVTARGRRVWRQYSIRAGVPHEIRVRVGIPDLSWLSDVADRPLPTTELPQDQDSHELVVIFSEPHLGEPQTAQIVLPRRGNSTVCSFHVFPQPNIKRIEARILVAYRNRVLQTALLRARITSRTEKHSNAPIELDVEAVLRTNLGDLAPRADFAAALVLNHDPTGISGITALADDAVARFTPSPTLRAEVDNLDKLLTEIVRNPRAYMGDLFSEATEGLLRQFAQHGSLLYDHIVLDAGLADAGLAGDGPLQVISAVPDARLPVELVYAREAPTNAARLCPQAAKALSDGMCGNDCSSPGREHEVICPLAFWGVKRVIERHRFTASLAKVAYGEEFVVLGPGSERRPLDVLRGGIVAGSQRVEKTVCGGLKDICERIVAWANTPVEPLSTWEAWTKRIDEAAPSVLVLIVHTEPSQGDETIPQMEIGADSWLTVVELGERHIRKSGSEPPLVLLLGCETGIPDRQFANFISRLRNRGAAIVVAAGSKIHSLHAVPVAKAFVDAIRDAVRQENRTFGEVMRSVRRQMLAQGIPMVLTLTAYGDADWKLVQHV